MLRSLTVEGFGLIDRTSVELEPGLNAFTGETGGGKSMVIDALGFVFGERAGPDVVRAGSEKAVVFAELIAQQNGDCVAARERSRSRRRSACLEPRLFRQAAGPQRA